MEYFTDCILINAKKIRFLNRSAEYLCQDFNVTVLNSFSPWQWILWNVKWELILKNIRATPCGICQCFVWKLCFVTGLWKHKCFNKTRFYQHLQRNRSFRNRGRKIQYFWISFSNNVAVICNRQIIVIDWIVGFFGRGLIELPNLQCGFKIDGDYNNDFVFLLI